MITEGFYYKETYRFVLISLRFQIGSLKQKLESTSKEFLFDIFTLESIDEVITVSLSMIICVIKSKCNRIFLLDFNC
jgi:hypothetical protein